MDAEITKQYIATLVADLKDELDVLTANRQQAEALYGALRRYESMLGKVRFLRRLSRLAELVLDETGGVQERVRTAAGRGEMMPDEALVEADIADGLLEGIGDINPGEGHIRMGVGMAHRVRDASADMMALVGSAVAPLLATLVESTAIKREEVTLRRLEAEAREREVAEEVALRKWEAELREREVAVQEKEAGIVRPSAVAAVVPLEKEGEADHE